MSRSGTDQKKRRMVVVVLALLVVVATINARTFLTGEAQPAHRPEADATELSLPFDLEEAAQSATVHLAAMRAGGGTDLGEMFDGRVGDEGMGSRDEAAGAGVHTDTDPATAQAIWRFTGMRDPFQLGSVGGRGVTGGEPAVASSSGKTAGAGGVAKATTKRSGLSCTAVMIGVGESLARIAGRFLKVGDEVRGYRVVHIDRTGAMLKKNDKQLFLPVGTKTDEKTYHRPVTGPGSGGRGR